MQTPGRSECRLVPLRSASFAARLCNEAATNGNERQQTANERQRTVNERQTNGYESHYYPSFMDLLCMFLSIVVLSISSFIRKERALKAQSH